MSENKVFDGASVRLARSALNCSLSDLGERVGKSKQFLQRLEAGQDLPTTSLVEALAASLYVEREFFYQLAPQRLHEDAFHFRKLLGTRSADIQSAMAKGELFRRLVQYLDTRLKLPKLDFPSYEIATAEAAERAAERCRVHWSLGLGPIDNTVRVLENAGAVVTTFTDSAREIDAMCIASTRPIVVTNTEDASTSRIRFGHCHELGHFVGHAGKVTGDRAHEAEANRFASAFLLPRSSFVKEFPVLRGGTQVNWVALSALKQRWGVSKAAMLYRAKQLAILSEDQYRRALVGHLYSRGERHIEKDEHLVYREEPELLVNAAQALRTAFGITCGDVARTLHIKLDLLVRIAPQLLTPTDNVLSMLDFRGRASVRVQSGS